jgi:hypothetical protein
VGADEAALAAAEREFDRGPSGGVAGREERGQFCKSRSPGSIHCSGMGSSSVLHHFVCKDTFVAYFALI